MTRLSFRVLFIAAVLLLTLGLVACGGSEEPAVDAPAEENMPAPTEAAAPAQESAAPEEAAPADETSAAGPISSFQDVKQAAIQIEAQGSFVDPEAGLQQNTAGRGSGFIIDPSGIAVTNNHVVTGAAFLQVWIGGEDEPRNAKILGVSECSDLAVIDIDGDGYPYLAWFDGATDVGQEIYVAGFPLGDPEYTMTRGIISKREAGGESSWASVDRVIEYDASTNPGNSGGAVVDANGRVVAVHYAGRGDTRQAFGIGHDVAKGVVEQLRQGTDVHSIGINGTAINDGEGLSGIWVASVESGSPADEAGVQGGDIITKLEGLVLATDGSMSDYCDILRSHNASDTLSIEVLRFATQEVLAGQLNGRALEQVVSFAQEVAEEAGGDIPQGSGSYTEFVGIYDDSGSMYMEVPVEWGEVDGAPWVSDGQTLGGSLAAATSLDGFYNRYDTPGVIMLAAASIAGDMNAIVDSFDYSADCTLDGRYDYEDAVYTGVYDLYTDCVGTGNVLVVLGAQPADAAYGVALLAQAVTQADLEALDKVLATFNVVGTLPQ